MSGSRKYCNREHKEVEFGTQPSIRSRFETLKRDNFTCQYCGRNVKEDKVKLHVDHIIPRNKGGLDISENLITSCSDCNLGKSDICLHHHNLYKG